MSTRSDWGERSSSPKEDLKEDDAISMTREISTMSFESARRSVDRIISLDRKIIRYNKRTISELIYEHELVRNMTMEICYEATNTNHNSIYIPIKVCLERYNEYELCAYIDSDSSVYFEKRILFSKFM